MPTMVELWMVFISFFDFCVSRDLPSPTVELFLLLPSVYFYTTILFLVQLVPWCLAWLADWCRDLLGELVSGYSRLVVTGGAHENEVA
jgi:hypothetical protein